MATMNLSNVLIARHDLSGSKRPCFAMQYAAFCSVKGGILDCKEYEAVCFLKALLRHSGNDIPKLKVLWNVPIFIVCNLFKD